MQPKERIRATFDHQPTDRVPVHHIGFSSAVASMILDREVYVGGGIQQWREATALWEGESAHQEFLERSRQDAFDVAVALGHDIVRMQYWRMPTKPTRRLDAHTFLYGNPEATWQVRRYDPGTELYQVVEQNPGSTTALDFEALESQVAQMERRLENYQPTATDFASTRELISTYGEQHAVRVAGGSLGIPYEPAIWLEAVLLRPDLVGRYLDAQAERAVRAVPGMAEVGVEYLFGGGDFASNDAPFYSPQAFHDFMLPPLKRICDACHQHGIRYLFASDGNLWSLADDLFGNSGVDGYYEIDGRAGMDLRRLRERYPYLVLIGNISSQTLHLGTPVEVTAETRACLDEAHRSGGIIVGVSNYLLPGTPQANLDAMLETIERYR